MRFHWFLPTNGDGRHVANVVSTVGVARPPRRPASVSYLAQVARAAEATGFEAVLTPTGAGCEDAWVTTAMLTQHTTDLRFLVAFRPGYLLPTLAAQQAATFQRLSGGRLALNIVTGGDPAEQRSYGDRLDHGDRYARTEDFLQVLRAVTSADGPVDVRGAHYVVEGGGFPALPAPPPPVYFGGASAAAERVAARYADVHLMWGEPLESLRERRDRVAALAAQQGRVLGFGVRLHVISRDTADEAWDEADRLLAAMDPVVRAQARERYRRMDSVGQARMAALSDGLSGSSAREQLVGPQLWAGIGLVREGAGTALVGSHDEVAERLAELGRAGFDEVVLSGWPHLEEAYRVGEDVLPRVAAALADAQSSPGTQPAVA